MADRKAYAVDSLEFFARCAGGFEETLAQELRLLGMRRVRPQVGGVIFFGTLRDAYRACLWLRCATRVQLVLARVPASSADELYQGVYDIAWEEHLVPQATIAVDAHGQNEELRNTKFTALRVKDAVCDRLRAIRGTRPDVDAKDPDFAINVALHPRKATIYLNLSGASLHRRGYRADGVQTEAPLKETLAAGILLMAGWQDVADAQGCLVDPMCGSGTFAIEAALMAAHAAPGLLRERWGFEGWIHHDQALWESVVSDAQCARDWESGAPRILAGDIDERAVRIARENAARAGVDDLIRFAVDDAAHLKRQLKALRGRGDSHGLLVANPPYGMRLLSQAQLPEVNASLAAAMDALPKGWAAVLVTPDAGIDTALGRCAQAVLACHNGPIAAWVRQYDLTEKPHVQQVVSLAGHAGSVRVADAGSAQFTARLRKVAKERSAWARGEGIGGYRVYDADLPNFALSVDVYDGTDGARHVVVEERRRPRTVDEVRAGRRFADAVALATSILDASPERVHARPWDSSRASGHSGQTQPAPVAVTEHGHAFSLDLTARPDTGLPLWLRGVRELVGEWASGRQVVSLFGSTSACAVYAAACGAAGTVTIDQFEDRVRQAKRQMASNGLLGKAHRFVCEDARTWIEQQARDRRQYDLIVCAPPAWLAAGGPHPDDWQLQRDHVEMIQGLTRLLGSDGAIVFACLDRTFVLDECSLTQMGLTIQDLSAQTLPHDFVRSERDYRCYALRRDVLGSVHH